MINNVRITTDSGAIYAIRGGRCSKTSSRGARYDSFYIFDMKSVPLTFSGNLLDIRELPAAEPKVGDLLFISGRDEWWLSTPIRSIENLSEKD